IPPVKLPIDLIAERTISAVLFVIHGGRRVRLTMDSRIFLSYRRDDAGGEAHAIRVALRQEFGAGVLFVDSASLEPGAMWPEELRSALERTDTVLAVIGPDWLRAGTSEWGERRIDKGDDWVRQ